ncbi:MAG TPA: hypothetical protein VK536_05015 [Candidatus Limnocylindrales bacterium]|nr:hypothetical protein [Candidatus Limnocylindrales bacterium]
MERKEAVALLREVIGNNLAQPKIVSLEKNQSGRFNLVMNDECNNRALKRFVAQKNLIAELDKKKGYLVIHGR